MFSKYLGRFLYSFEKDLLSGDKVGVGSVTWMSLETDIIWLITHKVKSQMWWFDSHALMCLRGSLLLSLVLSLTTHLLPLRLRLLRALCINNNNNNNSVMKKTWGRLRRPLTRPSLPLPLMAHLNRRRRRRCHGNEHVTMTWRHWWGKEGVGGSSDVHGVMVERKKKKKKKSCEKELRRRAWVVR